MLNISNRILQKSKRILASYGIAPTNQEFEFKNGNTESLNKRILLVGAGNIPIPPTGWGAVETIISETVPHYLNAGLSVGLLNSLQGKQWKLAKGINWDHIICHSDDLVKRVRKNWPSTNLVSITHYGLAAQPEKWHRSYRKVFQDLHLANQIVCLSPAIMQTFQKYFADDKLLLAPNGSSFNPKIKFEKNRKVIYLGKVEERKKQFECWKALQNSGFEIEFIGPIEDKRVISEIKKSSLINKIFVGPVNRSYLVEELSKYQALLLLSEGEADALVLYEAQLAGLPVITNSQSLGGQDPKLPWIKVVSKVEQIQDAIIELESAGFDKNDITTYSQNNYNWESRLKPIIELVMSEG